LNVKEVSKEKLLAEEDWIRIKLEDQSDSGQDHFFDAEIGI